MSSAAHSPKTMSDYLHLFAELEAIGERTGTYLCDQAIDVENVRDEGIEIGAPNYFDRLIAQACSAAGQRAEDNGIDINKEIGRVIY